MDVAYGIGKKLAEVLSLISTAGGFGSKRSRAHHNIAEHHIGIIHEILVHGDAVFVFAEVYPIGFGFNHSVSLLEEDDIRNDISPCTPEGIVRQTDCAEKLGPLCDILSYRRVLLIQSTL